jgi:hypothetical protein
MGDPMRQTPGQPPARRYPRMVAEYVVAYRLVQPEGGESAAQFSRTRTLGLGGLMFESEKPLDLDAILRMEIVLGEQTIRTTGVVVYVDRQGDSLWRHGVQFTEISENDRDALLGAYLQQEYRIAPV